VLPPEPVALLRWHVIRFCTASDVREMHAAPALSAVFDEPCGCQVGGSGSVGRATPPQSGVRKRALARTPSGAYG
jgi:hypothetical protein